MLRTIVLSIVLLSSPSVISAMSPDHLIIPLNPKLTITPSLTRATSLRLLALALGTCGTALLYQGIASEKNAQGQHVNITETTVGVICTLISLLMLHTTQDK